MKGSTFHLQVCIGFNDKREQVPFNANLDNWRRYCVQIYTFFEKIYIVSEFTPNFRDYI